MISGSTAACIEVEKPWVTIGLGFHMQDVHVIRLPTLNLTMGIILCLSNFHYSNYLSIYLSIYLSGILEK